ncbi:hypothetical protein GNE08_23155 [Trichormus variabilis ARAD]|uniref:Uncharacterized protein n=1 Tax=Trichormus variabilis N2B TaxID=2681315 RepID=A0ABR6SDJ5_ANAVA|nr:MULTISPECIES: hypothetical protein [Nostocaceae]MBC1217108.1 hypothetical protein [Trichormus variabilis ARAD]MBC1256673.1 hypothetical protein [Trichormus variabilis V5]MBC1269120.1 hypothetical protein [Trichormus variabilis FSR]MBC1304499.1 hypothetical protein [Trichormus variabilis N2B]MBC1312943.1 hypothetical protein [Trichormus variabilis PNB]
MKSIDDLLVRHDSFNLEMLLNAIEGNLFELYGLFCAGVGVPEKPVGGEKGREKKIFEKRVDKGE